MKSVIETYRDLAKNNPPWTPDEEKEAIKKWFKADKERFIDEAMKHNLGLVFNLINRMSFNPTDDMIQQAVSSLVSALRKFKPSKNVKLSTWITNPIRWSILQCRSAYLHQCTISEELSYLNARFGKNYRSVSFDAEIGTNNDEDNGDTIGSMISESSVNINYSLTRKFKTSDEIQAEDERTSIMNEFLKDINKILNKREVKVIKGILKNKNLTEIAKDMNLSRMRISQVARDAYSKIRVSKWAGKLKEFI